MTGTTNQYMHSESMEQPSLEEQLLIHGLLSKIEKDGSRIYLTLTERGADVIEYMVNRHHTEPSTTLTTPQPQANEDNLLTKQQVMERLSVSSTTLWLWEKKEYLTPRRIGRKVFYSPEDIKKLSSGM